MSCINEAIKFTSCFDPPMTGSTPGPSGAFYGGNVYYHSGTDEMIYKTDGVTDTILESQDVSSGSYFSVKNRVSIWLDEDGKFYVRDSRYLRIFPAFPLTTPERTLSLGSTNIKCGLAVDIENDMYAYVRLQAINDYLEVRRLSDNVRIVNTSLGFSTGNIALEFLDGELYSCDNDSEPDSIYKHDGLTASRTLFTTLSDNTVNQVMRFVDGKYLLAGYSSKICLYSDLKGSSLYSASDGEGFVLDCFTMIPRTFAPTTELPRTKDIPLFKTACDFKGQMIVGNLITS